MNVTPLPGSFLYAAASGGIIGSLCEVHPDACLTVAAISSVVQIVNGALILAEV